MVVNGNSVHVYTRMYVLLSTCVYMYNVVNSLVLH